MSNRARATKTGPKVIHRKLVDGEWVEKTIYSPPSVDWNNVRKNKKSACVTKKKRNNKRRMPKKSVNKFYKSHEYIQWRYKVLKASNGHCELCGRGPEDGVTLQADHIKPIHKYPELKLDPSNGQCVCSACNWGKWGDDETDWRKQHTKMWPGLTPICD